MDELTYCLFAGMGGWGHQDRKAVAADHWDRFADFRLQSAAAEILRKLYGCELYDGASPHPVPIKELEGLLVQCIKQWPRDRRKLFVSDVPKARDWAKYYAAHLLAEQLGDFTILRDSPEPPFFRWANFEGGSGPLAESEEEAERRRFG
jgi:hypothetical protein